MAYFQYVAAESIMTGHVNGVTYDFDWPIQMADRTVKTLREQPASLSGKTETLYFGKQSRWSVTLAPVLAQERFLIEEFLDSVANGQVFSFDPHGTELRPQRLLQVVRDDEEYTVRRKTITGQPEELDYLEYSFSVLER